MLIHWIVSALLLLVVSHIVPGFIVRGFLPALVAALVMGLVNATLGLFLKILTFPLTIVTFGVFLLVINALMLLLTSHVVRGFTVQGFRPAFWGALLLAILQLLMRWLAPGRAI
jgi:putative membrane protein